MKKGETIFRSFGDLTRYMQRNIKVSSETVLFVLLINFNMPTTAGILKFISKTDFMFKSEA